MTGTSWMKSLLMSVLGLGTMGGAALAAPPSQVPGGSHERGSGDLTGFGFDGLGGRHDGWQDGGFDGKDGRFDGRHDGGLDGRDGRFDGRGDRFDGPSWRLVKLGKLKIEEGRALQYRGERLLRQARFIHSYRLTARARMLIAQGERVERLGWSMVRDARH